MSSEHTGPVRHDLTPAMLERLLQRLGDSPDEAGERYNTTRTRVIRFFHWHQLVDAEALADEVLSRVARRLAEGEVIPNIFGYVAGVARLVALEARQRSARERRAMEEYSRRAAWNPLPAVDDRALECLERCLADLDADRRAHLLAYYSGDRGARIRRRSELAERLGIGQVALRNRMLRLRQRLEGCLAACLERRHRDGSAASGTSIESARTPHSGDDRP